MSSANGQPDWASDELYLEDLATFIGKHTRLKHAQVAAAERADRVYDAGCYRGFGGPILDGLEDVDFEALNRKYPDIIPAKGYFVHTSHEDRIVFIASEVGISHKQAIEYLAQAMAFRRAAGISTSEDEDEAGFRRWAAQWLAESRGLRLVKDDDSDRCDA